MRLNGIRKIPLSVLELVLVLTMVLSGCDGLNYDDQTPSSSETSNPQPSDDGSGNDENNSVDPTIVLNQGAYTTSYNYKDEDSNSTWDNNATTIILEGSSTQVSGSGASFSGGILTINKAGTFVLSGTLANGQILIDASKNDLVRLVMNGVYIHNETAPAIYAPQSDKVILILADGTQNTISDGAAYPASTDDDNPEAAIYVQDDLSITGSGQLTVTGNYKHGIRAQDNLVITSGTINITSVSDAIRGRDGVAIRNGSITLNAGGDGIQSNNANSDDVGFIIINGGSFEIKSKNDGIQAQSSLTVTGGTFNIFTGGGSANAPTRVEDFRGGGGGRGGWGGQQGQSATTADEESESMKALKAGKQVYVMGGNFTIDAEDDGVHSNGDVLIASGTLTIKTGDDGVHADAATIVSGGEINIPVCYEGIEGLSVTISGGDITVIANDDAINAAGGADSASQGGGPMGGDRFAVNGDIFIRISGGNIDLYAPYDGIDSNGNIFLEGGTVKISGPSQSMDGAIDLDGTMLITGGELITAGSVVNVSSESTQATILVSYTQQQSSGNVIAIKDSNGNKILEYTSAIAFSMSGFTSPDFVIGETYTLYIDGEKRVDIELTSVVTSIADDGSIYSGGMGGGRGNWGGGGQMPQGGEMPQGGGNRPDGGQMPTDGSNPGKQRAVRTISFGLQKLKIKKKIRVYAKAMYSFLDFDGFRNICRYPFGVV